MKSARLCLLFLLAAALPLLAVNTTDTRLLTTPTVGANGIAFGYANDIWTANLDGSGVRRLTSHPGVETLPRYSPDGSLLAFSGSYEGNVDVYVMPAAGGVPKRLTWHPDADAVLGFTPDGKSILFTSPREVYTRRYQQLFTVPVGGGAVTKLPIPNASTAAYSPDGKTIAFVPLREAFAQWKRYRGGATARIFLFDVATNAVEQVPQPAARSNDTDPIFIGDTLYFRSDRNGEFNLYSFDRGTKEVKQLTKYSDFPVTAVNGGAGKLIFEQAGYLHLYEPSAARDTRLKIGVAADLVETRPRFVKGAKYIRNASLSPAGQRAVLEYRGEIITLPAEKGDDRNLTQSPGANDRSPAWSPDGKSIAWFTDETGEYELRIAPQDGRGDVRKIKLNGAGFYENPKWSPDGKLISYLDNSRSVYVLDVASGTSTKISQNTMYGPFRDLDHNWSPDSKWLAYTTNSQNFFHTVHVWSVATKTSSPVTDGYSDAMSPVFDPNGKYLYFLASTNAGPVEDWFALSNTDLRATSAIYMVVLPKGVVSPLAKESDEEAAKKADEAADKSDDKKKADEKKEESKDVKVVIDFERLSQRIQALPVPEAIYSDLAIAKTGQLLYLKATSPEIHDDKFDTSLMRFDLTKRKEDTLLEKCDSFEVSRDGKRILVKAGMRWSIADMGDKVDISKRPLPVDQIAVKIEPTVEWKQIFDEAWRINRDYFYDPAMHGVDWKAMHDKYAAMLGDVSVRQDLNRLMRAMASELSVGHSYLTGGESLANVDTIPGGLLGADYKIDNNRYRFAKVYGGLNWNPELRAPLTEPGVDVREGEYLLAVDGKDLRYPDNLYARFERTAGRIVEITVGPNADGSGSRVVKVVPIENEANLRNRAWIENNIRYVTEKTNGRVAYVYLPNTSTAGYESFRRYFFPQANREAAILDERYNGGGSFPDYYIDILNRPFIANWATRYGADMKTPLASIQGPKVMLIDENAGSGGDLLPWMFRKLNLGPLIGRRTWGGLVGILGFPDLMDGGNITAPNFGFWTEEGWKVENEGVAPDIEVEQTPADVIAGRDPQLDRAIAEVMKKLPATPATPMKRPAFPNKVAATNSR
ncbi:MAG: tricorn protease [Acidobacteriota bacterium]|jgi:tricorn protease|nr:tricorn protease [Acidobacteriota bacterium]